ncbi:two pore domain potassium channel family protein [Bradyrhizobium frederickii]|uniref:Two pore domain potassium channel family protein n=1 Tax=Bradyrhizobium frederickii TaxID=2560054 RepID=A0A4Y9L2E1_9BRAD|nr:potassium channel family protein [Bradyrhizobium frederickii]TFV36404.1 two pore domain potassium channel family protein [Bradyrhizobium frederickii]
MLLQLLVGGSVSVVNIGLHALVTIVAVGIARGAGLRRTERPRLHLMGVMIATAAVLKVAHTVEILVWAWTYGLVRAAAPGSDLLYFAFVNYTTLGYGDITPVPEWRLMGPLTAMNGVLLFGWSAAILFEVLRKTLDHVGLIDVPASGSRQPDAPMLGRGATDDLSPHA